VSARVAEYVRLWPGWVKYSRSPSKYQPSGRKDVGESVQRPYSIVLGAGK
jgi:hypothetical protein